MSSDACENTIQSLTQHVVGVELFGQHDLHALAEVAQRLPHRVLGAEQHEQHTRCARARPSSRRARAPRAACTPSLVFGSLMPQSSTTMTFSSAARSESARAQREPHHLLGRALRVVARLGAVRHTTAAPLRRADRTLTGPAGALLAPRLGAAAAHLGARLGAVRAGALGRELRGDDLVHHRDVRLDAEDVVGQLDGVAVAAVGRLHRERGHALHPRLHRVADEHEAAGRAGDRTLDEQQVALGVALDDFEVERGDLASLPNWPAIACP